jgi:hypothetical protein
MRLSRNLLAAVLVAAAAMPASAWGADRLVTAVQDPLDPAFLEPDPAGAYEAARAAGARVVRVPVVWARAAPRKPTDATDPDDPAYDWAWLDARVAAIRRAGMESLLVLYAPPNWARIRESDGSLALAAAPGDFAAWAFAAARRYDGTHAGLPRVRYWQIWNEPNLSAYFSVRRGPRRYRGLLNAGYQAIHLIRADNVVVGGGLAPFGGRPEDWSPLRFMRQLLCVPPEATCRARSQFDVWAHNPYTSGGPTHEAVLPDDVSLGDLPEMRAVLSAARRAHRVVSRGRPGFWITEFSWDTRPPDRFGVRLQVHARWLAEALYRMWRNDASLVTWFALRDGPEGTQTFAFEVQAGLYFRTTARYADERTKPALRAFRFPFAAVPERGRVSVWGRTPDSRRHMVTLERRRRGGGWVRVDRLRTTRHGIFFARRGGLRGAVLRARVGGSRSLPFRAVPTPDRPVRPFGDGPAS